MYRNQQQNTKGMEYKSTRNERMNERTTLLLRECARADGNYVSPKGTLLSDWLCEDFFNSNPFPRP